MFVALETKLHRLLRPAFRVRDQIKSAGLNIERFDSCPSTPTDEFIDEVTIGHEPNGWTRP